MHLNLVTAAYSLALVGSCAAFYNNPEPATPYSQGASVEDLENRWSVDVGIYYVTVKVLCLTLLP